MLCSVEVVTKAGQRYSSEVAYHKGHYRNPMSESDVAAKFRSLTRDLLSPGQIDRLLERLWRLEEVKDVGEVIRMTVV
jgi:2-methylcitrate dehydratase